MFTSPSHSHMGEPSSPLAKVESRNLPVEADSSRKPSLIDGRLKAITTGGFLPPRISPNNGLRQLSGEDCAIPPNDNTRLGGVAVENSDLRCTQVSLVY